MFVSFAADEQFPGGASKLLASALLVTSVAQRALHSPRQV